MTSLRNRGRLCAATLVIVFSFLCGTHASAGPTAEDKETARTLLADGRKKMGDKDYEGALKAFRAAHAIMGVPTTGLDLARAQEALSLLVEARETALAVTKIPVQPNEAKVFAKARASAQKLADDIAPRIPSIVVTVSGLPAGVEPVVTIDGKPIMSAALGLPSKVNPGKHVIEAKATGYLAERREVELKEKETRPTAIELKIDPLGNGAPTSTPTATAVAATPPPKPTATATATVAPTTTATSAPPLPPRSVPVWVWIGGGVGLASAGASVGFFIDHLAARDTVEKDCPNDTCDPAKYDLDAMNALRGRWNRDLGLGIGFGALALAGISAAIVGFVAAPTGEKQKVGIRIVPVAGPSTGGLHLTGDF